ncbi:MAG TPA: metallophosphoesterase [bacterium]|nr:metallophosphoesterase [bacterium]
MRKIHILLILVCLAAWGCASLNPAQRAGFSFTVEPAANPWTHLEFKNNPADFQFAVISDRGGGERPGIFDKTMPKINLLQPEFVMSVGDLMEGYSEDKNEVVRQWNELDGYVSQLEMPFFYVTGNHDYTNPMMAAYRQERHGRTYYHFVYQDVLFLIVNSEDPTEKRPNMTDEQNAYLAKALRDNPDVRWTFVFLHRPLWEDKEVSGWTTFEQNLQGRPYTVIAGHVHNYTKCIRHGREYYTLATTGGSSKLRGIEYGEFDHILWITMTNEGPRIAILMCDGIQDTSIRMK